MVKVILFDFDGVVTTDKDDKGGMFRIFKRETGLPEKVLLEKIQKHISAPLYYGKVKFKTCWKALCKELGVSEDLVKEYIGKTPIDKKIVNLAKKLKKEGYTTGILTTNSSYRMKKITKHFKLKKAFQEIFVSADFGLTKWEKKFFTQVVKRLKVSPEEIVFIDNSARNLIEPKKMGMKTIFYTYSGSSCRKLIAELKKLGVLR